MRIIKEMTSISSYICSQSRALSSTMKPLILATALAIAPAPAYAFAPALPWGTVAPVPPSSTALRGLFDLKPFHAGGSGEGQADLDEQWEAQQAILAARKGHHDKTALRSKYVGGGPKHFQTESMKKKAPAGGVGGRGPDVSSGGEVEVKKQFKFPWER